MFERVEVTIDGQWHDFKPKTVHLTETVVMVMSEDDEFFNANPVLQLRYSQDLGHIYVLGWQPYGSTARKIEMWFS